MRRTYTSILYLTHHGQRLATFTAWLKIIQQLLTRHATEIPEAETEHSRSAALNLDLDGAAFIWRFYSKAKCRISRAVVEFMW